MEKFVIKNKEDAFPAEAEAIVPYNKLCRIVNEIKFIDHEEFQINNTDYKLFLCDQDEGQPVEFHASTKSDGFDIYIWDSLKSKGLDFLRVFMLHELVETSILKAGNEDQQKLSQSPHDIAVLYEKRFLRQTLKPERQKEFVALSGILRGNSFHDFTQQTPLKKG